MADPSDTGAGDAVLTVLDRFLAAGISLKRSLTRTWRAGGSRSPDSGSPMRPPPRLRRSPLRSCSSAEEGAVPTRATARRILLVFAVGQAVSAEPGDDPRTYPDASRHWGS